MIHYSLKCTNGHLFDSWFKSAGAFDRLADAGHLACPQCASSSVQKALMAPAVAAPRGAAAPPASSDPTPEQIERAIAALRRQVEENSDYVGLNFAAEARRIHSGDAPERAIHGEARPEEARRLIEDGVPVAPLPFVPRRKAN